MPPSLGEGQNQNGQPEAQMAPPGLLVVQITHVQCSIYGYSFRLESTGKYPRREDLSNHVII